MTKIESVKIEKYRKYFLVKNIYLYSSILKCVD